LPSTIPGVFEAEPVPIPLAALDRLAEKLAVAIAANDDKAVRREIFALIEVDDGGQAAATAVGVIAALPSIARVPAANAGIPLAANRSVAPMNAAAGATP
jgi:hypothetical protein